MSGRLYIVATPIGNLEDITLRALRVLKEVSWVACEDTRRTVRLLNHYGISKPLISYHEFNERTRAPELIGRLKSGTDGALVSDAGMPGISDPGYRVITLAIREGIPIVPVPGPSALDTALVISGLPTDRFVFEGFLPEKQAQRRKALATLSGEIRTIIFFETARRLKQCLEDVLAVLGDREAVLAHELTKKFETVERSSLSGLLENLAGAAARGEYVVVMAGRSETGKDHTSAVTADDVFNIMETLKVSKKEAIALAAKLGGVMKKEIYRAVLKKDNL